MEKRFIYIFVINSAKLIVEARRKIIPVINYLSGRGWKKGREGGGGNGISFRLTISKFFIYFFFLAIFN